jgi:serine/threonine-protein kinase
MSEPPHPEQTAPYERGTPAEPAATPALTQLLRRQAERWQHGDCVRVEDLLAQSPALAADSEAVLNVIGNELMLRAERGETPDQEEYLRRFPHLADQLQSHFAVDQVLTAAAPPVTPAATGRYQLLEEIARGGMGAVLRGHDHDLDRELAIKVLLDDYRDEPNMVRRFLTEARISARLQHPGIVPVHELGRLPDGRPFLAMKLVQGRTLAELLAERHAPSDDLPRFLGIFAQICQTLAYAHSRGVIHRDLKPGNIMVGEFGEVQVMDWGLAKALSVPGSQAMPSDQGAAVGAGSYDPIEGLSPEFLNRGETHAGAVLGTLAYMPPEQARGEVDRLDERCDVFGLGAILCQILTSQPPYEGRNHQEVHHQALHAELTTAWQRLATCGADAELIALAKECLAPDPQQRPRHAGEVAGRIRAYEESVQDRLRQAELERAAAQARAQEEQKRRQAEAARAEEERKRRVVEQGKARAERQRRRVTVALAASVLLLLAGASTAGLWYQARQAELQARRNYVQREVTAALDEAGQLQQELHQKLDDPLQVHELLSDIDGWGRLVQRAQTAWQRAQSLADSEPDLLAADLTQRLRHCDEQLQADQHDFELARNLDVIRLEAERLIDGRLNHRKAATKYAKVLADAGYDFKQPNIKMLAARIRQSRVRLIIVAALDHWVVATADPSLQPKLLALSRHADPNPFRTKTRATLGASLDGGARQEIAAAIQRRKAIKELQTLARQV